MEKALGVGLISGIVTAIVFLWLCLDFCRFKRARILAREADKILFHQIAKGRVGLPSVTSHCENHSEEKSDIKQRRKGSFYKILSLFKGVKNKTDTNTKSNTTELSRSKELVRKGDKHTDLIINHQKSNEESPRIKDQGTSFKGRKNLLKMQTTFSKIKEKQKDSYDHVKDGLCNSNSVLRQHQSRKTALERNTSSPSLQSRSSIVSLTGPKDKLLPPIRNDMNFQRA